MRQTGSRAFLTPGVTTRNSGCGEVSEGREAAQYSRSGDYNFWAAGEKCGVAGAKTPPVVPDRTETAGGVWERNKLLWLLHFPDIHAKGPQFDMIQRNGIGPAGSFQQGLHVGRGKACAAGG